jgi:hypothetical protein
MLPMLDVGSWEETVELRHQAVCLLPLGRTHLAQDLPLTLRHKWAAPIAVQHNTAAVKVNLRILPYLPLLDTTQGMRRK